MIKEAKTDDSKNTIVMLYDLYYDKNYKPMV